MSVFKNVEIHFVRLVRPDPGLSKENPAWGVQMRTTDPAQRLEWKEAGLTVKKFDPEENPGYTGPAYWYASVRKNKFKKDTAGKPTGVENTPPEVIGGLKMLPIDASTIGNGSIANISTYNYTNPKGDISHQLLALQIVKHKVYVPKRQEAFTPVDIEREEIEDDSAPFDEDAPF